MGSLTQIHVGMTGFDSVILVRFRFCSGWQRFPYPSLQPIDASKTSKLVSYAEGVAAGVVARLSLSPYAMAA